MVGESGSGKSTLAKLLVHFYDVTDGRITLGGQDLREMSLASLNEQISFVAQEQFLFNTSLLENIRLGRPGATDEEVLAAAERAQCGEFLKRLEKGIYTMAGDGGKGLSGGERQRIALARAILKDAPIVVLDEATAFLDPENEEKMNAAIAEVIRGKTVIVIAHRLQSIAGADQIVVLDQGNVAGIGRTIHCERLAPPMKNCGGLPREPLPGVSLRRKEAAKHDRADETNPVRIRPLSGADQAGLCLCVLKAMLSKAPIGLSFLALSAFLQGTMTARLCLWLAVGAVGCVLLECLCQNIADRLQAAAGYMVFADLRMELGRHLRRLPMGYFTEGNIGKISSVLSTDMVFIEENCMHDIANMMSYTFAQAILVLWLAFLNPWLGLAAWWW